MLVDLALVSCSLDDQYVQYSTVQNAVHSVDYRHLNSFDLAKESKTSLLRGPGLGIQLRGLALDS